MPYKKGPNNTLRFYDTHTGRYASMPFMSFAPAPKNKKSYEERLKEKREMLYNRAIKSKDKYLYDIFIFIENNFPGEVSLINDKIYHKEIKSTREIDLVTKKCIIEIKSGKVKHRSKQFLAQKDFAKDYNKHHIVYAPDITDKKLIELKNKGIDVVRKKEDLLERIKK